MRVRILPEVSPPNDCCSWTPSCCMNSAAINFLQIMHTCPAHQTSKVSTIWIPKRRWQIDRYIMSNSKEQGKSSPTAELLVKKHIQFFKRVMSVIPPSAIAMDTNRYDNLATEWFVIMFCRRSQHLKCFNNGVGTVMRWVQRLPCTEFVCMFII